MNNRPLDVIVSGHLCLDMLPRMEHVTQAALTRPGHLIETGPLDISTGGAVSNVGLALHRLGANVRLMATVGDDLIGRAIVDFVNARDPALSQLIRVQDGQESSYTIVLSPERTDRTFLHCPGINGTFDGGNINFGLLEQAKIFYLGYPTLLPRLMIDDGAELEAIFRRAKAAGVVTALDMTLPDPNGPGGQVNWAKLLARTLPYVDIFLPSIEEILFMLRRADFEAWRGYVLDHLTMPYLHDLAGELLAIGTKITGFKLGEQGMYLRCADASHLSQLGVLDVGAWAEAEIYCPAFQVEVIGTTGAGDSAYGGFLSALLRGLPPRETVQFACAVGACNVEAADATSGVRTWDETMTRIAADWPPRNQRISL